MGNHQSLSGKPVERSGDMASLLLAMFFPSAWIIFAAVQTSRVTLRERVCEAMDAEVRDSLCVCDFNASKAGLLLVTAVLLLASVTLAAAQSGGGYDLTWNTIDDGGGASIGGGYMLNGTVGQPDAGVPSSGGGYTLVGGFWGGAAAQYRIYLPVILRN